jgi:predicted phosphoribosyltransferase
MVCRDPKPSDTPSNSDSKLAIPVADDSTKEEEKQDADCVFCVGRFSEYHSVEEWI